MRIGLVANIYKEGIDDVLGSLVSWLVDRKVEVYVDSKINQVLREQRPVFSEALSTSGIDIIAALGGDGTMLYAARIVGSKGIPIFGINIGSLGFLTTSPLEELYDSFEHIISGDYTDQDRMVLRIDYKDRDGSPHAYYALNDAVINNGAFARIIHLHVHVGSDKVGEYAADGIIVSTPTGSTGYSLAASGPIVFPTMGAVIITPICPHTMAVRPLVIPDNLTTTIKVEADHSDIMLTVDGQIGKELISGDEIKISKADYYVKFIKPFGRSFFSLLRQKLNWGLREEGENG